MLKLRVRANPHQAVWLVEPGVKIGRRVANDLILDHPDIADLHCVIAVRDERLLLKRRSAEHVVTVNGKSIVDRCLLSEGDVIAVGTIEMEVIDPKKERGTSSPSPSTVTQWQLKANTSALGDRVFPLGQTTVVGRSAECDIQLAEAHLSRRHAQLQVLNGLLYVKDLDSSNGTYLNGRRVSEARVRRGDELRFDTLAFGVLGPVDDLNKTTVRVMPLAEASPPTKAAPHREGVSRRVPPVAEPVTPVTEALVPRSRHWSTGLGVAGALIVLAVLGWWLMA
ncbi:FHA domain-containing protein [Marinimicrobium sp. ARAG 43.8]|uniref:FHA domain-containing protein n=1 Tax=Marinimicrobium sp. ARAG 43.8 TaxID=3418719 RepID=UPI003CF490C9